MYMVIYIYYIKYIYKLISTEETRYNFNYLKYYTTSKLITTNNN